MSCLCHSTSWVLDYKPAPPHQDIGQNTFGVRTCENFTRVLTMTRGFLLAMSARVEESCGLGRFCHLVATIYYCKDWLCKFQDCFIRTLILILVKLFFFNVVPEKFKKTQKLQSLILKTLYTVKTICLGSLRSEWGIYWYYYLQTFLETRSLFHHMCCS